MTVQNTLNDLSVENALVGLANMKIQGIKKTTTVRWEPQVWRAFLFSFLTQVL